MSNPQMLHDETVLLQGIEVGLEAREVPLFHRKREMDIGRTGGGDDEDPRPVNRYTLQTEPVKALPSEKADESGLAVEADDPWPVA